MDNYRYSPFNVFGVIVFVISFTQILGFINDSTTVFVISSIIGLFFILIDYFFQKKQLNIKLIFSIEFIIILSILIYFTIGIINTF
jgi:hypothetical protein